MAVADFDKLADDFVVLEQVAVVVDLDELADLEVEVAVVVVEVGLALPNHHLLMPAHLQAVAQNEQCVIFESIWGYKK